MSGLQNREISAIQGVLIHISIDRLDMGLDYIIKRLSTI